MRVVSLNAAKTQAIVKKSRPANSDIQNFKTSITLTRAVDQLYLIVKSGQIIYKNNIKILDIKDITTVKTNKIGSIFDAT